MPNPLVVYPSAANADGSLRYYPGASWAATHDATTATDVYKTNNPITAAAAYNSLNLIIRGYLPFDTSGIGANDVTAATLTVKGYSKTGSEGSICLVASTQASSTDLAATDYDNVGTTELATAIPLSSWSTSGTNTFTLNAAGLAHLNASGVTKFALRHSADLNNAQPSTDNSVGIYFSEESGTANDPKLTITLDLAPARVPALPKVTVFAPTAAPGSFGAYRGFGSTAALPDGSLICIAAKGSYHASPDSVLMAKRSYDNGATWGTEFSVPRLGGAEVTPLASGRIAGVTDGGTGVDRYPEYIYSDDLCETWSTPVVIDWDFYTGRAYINDVIELANGDLIASAHGEDTAGGVQKLRWSKSTDGGATWAPLSSIAAIGGYNTVEQRCAILNNGDVFTVFHTEDGTPTDYYYAISTDDCATWGTPVLIQAGNSFNRQGLTHFENDNLIIGVNSYSGPFSWTYRESRDGGVNFNDPTTLDTPTASWIPLKSAAVALKYSYGDSQQVGFTYSEESLDQQQAYTYYRQWSGVDGTIVYPKVLTPATETDAARALSVESRHTLTPATETGAAQALVVTAVDHLTLTPATETDAAQTLTIAASDVLILHPQGMVPGTTIGAYRRWEWKGPVAAKLNAGPGAVVQETTVASDLTASFTLAPGEYVAYASAYPTKRLFFMVTE